MALLIGTLIALAALGGCGLSAQDGPQAIAPQELPPELIEANPSTSTTVAGAAPVTVYLLVREGNATRLAPVPRDATNPTLPGPVIDALLARPTEAEQAAGYTSSITGDTVLLGTERVPNSEELVIDLSGALFEVQGRELNQAFAQIVWTVTELEGVSQVRFRVDGEDYRAPDAEGTEQTGAVTQSDYRTLAPDTSIAQATVPAETLDELVPPEP